MNTGYILINLVTCTLNTFIFPVYTNKQNINFNLWCPAHRQNDKMQKINLKRCNLQLNSSSKDPH